MKVLICPICAMKDLGEYDEGYFCHHCDHWVIPLATPQETEQNEANLLRNHSVMEG